MATKSPKEIRSRTFMITQQIKYLREDLNTLPKLFNSALGMKPQMCAGIVHDKDEDVQPHIHLSIRFKNPRTLNSISTKLGIPHQYIVKWNENYETAFSYLTHSTPKASSDGKYKYSPDDVQANFNFKSWLSTLAEKQDIITSKSNPSNDINHLLDLLYLGIINLEYVETHISGSEYAKNCKRIKDVHNKYLENLASARRAERKKNGQTVSVIWIYGDSGTGKTRFAKEQAEKITQNYFITGSSRDPFQLYEGEDVIIYDEARPNDIPYADLLRLLDPYGEFTSAPSRYYDKSICASTYFITSPYSPYDFFNSLSVNSKVDSFTQLLRRISLVVKMDNSEINGMIFIDDETKFIPLLNCCQPNPYISNNKIPESNSEEVFNSLFSLPEKTSNIDNGDHYRP